MKTIVALLTLLCVAITTTAQTFTERLQKTVAGKGTITVVHSAAIDKTGKASPNYARKQDCRLHEEATSRLNEEATSRLNEEATSRHDEENRHTDRDKAAARESKV